MANEKILVVDDDVNICELLRLYLEKEGYTVSIVNDGESAVKSFGEIQPDLMLLDIMLPKMDGFEVVRHLREKKIATPVILLTARDKIGDKVRGLDSGADDYVPKPFGIMELVARIKALLRRTENRADTTDDGEKLIAGSIALDTKRHIVLVDGERINLTLKEFELLHLFMENQGQVFTRDQLLNRIWGYEYIGDTRTVDVHIKRLREKINDHAHWRIATIWGIGYKFEVRN